MESDTRNSVDNCLAGSPPVVIPQGLKPEQNRHSQTTMVNRMFENISVSPGSLPSNEDAQDFMVDCAHTESEYSADHLSSCEHCVSRSLCSLDHDSRIQYQHSHNSEKLANYAQDEVSAAKYQEVNHWDNKPHDSHSADQHDKNELSDEYFSGTDNHQSILVSLSSTCVPKGLVCERSQLFRIKFYGSFDKPLGRYLREDLFDQVCPIFIL